MTCASFHIKLACVLADAQSEPMHASRTQDGIKPLLVLLIADR